MNAARRLIGEIRVTCDGGVQRVTAEVSGNPVWFESSAVDLAPSVEAFATAFLIPSLHQGIQLQVDQEVDREWMENIGRLLPILTKWWEYPSLAPLAPVKDQQGLSTRPQTALCFTGGVDSFHSLLRGGIKPRLLVYIHGYDIPLEDETRFAALKASFDVVAAAVNALPILVRSNLRQHVFFNACGWERTHGAALAAVGHLLSSEVSHFVISSTLVRSDERPWGSHCLTDPLWSSARLRIEQSGEDVWRHDKLRAIIDEPLVREHLRVCWENRRPTGNCSHCDKCLFTMIVLAQARKVDRFPVFEINDCPAVGRELATRIKRLPRTVYLRSYAILLNEGLDQNLSIAIKRLLDRSSSRPSGLQRFLPSRWRSRAAYL
ncbi:MAG: hypothetical protein ABI882_20985 [Acidobacteriota bacterium]